MPVRKKIPEANAVRERFIQSYWKLLGEKSVTSKTEFSKEVGLGGPSNMNRMEQNRREPSITNIILLHNKYGVSMDWIIFGKGKFLDKV